MKIEHINQLARINKLIIHSMESSLYFASVLIDGQEHVVENTTGELIKSRNTTELLALFNAEKVKSAVLRHQSAFDEMVGHQYSKTDNTLEVPIGFPDASGR